MTAVASVKTPTAKYVGPVVPSPGYRVACSAIASSATAPDSGADQRRTKPPAKPETGRSRMRRRGRGRRAGPPNTAAWHRKRPLRRALRRRARTLPHRATTGATPVPCSHRRYACQYRDPSRWLPAARLSTSDRAAAGSPGRLAFQPSLTCSVRSPHRGGGARPGAPSSVLDFGLSE